MEKQTMSFKGIALDPASTLSSLGLKDGDSICVEAFVCGYLTSQLIGYVFVVALVLACEAPGPAEETEEEPPQTDEVVEG